MDNFLTHTFSIKNHPICKLKEKFKIQYVMRLGEFMCYMSQKDVRAKLVFEVWARSIIHTLPVSCWQCTKNYSQIKTATSLKRDGFRFFSMRRIFVFDCFYLASTLNTELVTCTYSFLHENVRDIISRQILKDVYANWGKATQKKIPTELLKHQKDNETFNRKPLKKILVVATMSAGKSTLINALVGYRINAVKNTACTNKLCYLYNKPSADGIIVKREDGRFLYSYAIESPQKGEFNEAGLHFNSSLSECRICFIDTPGTNYSGNKSHGEITRKAILSNNYDAVIFVVNSLQFNTEDEATLRDFVLKHTQKPIIFVLNQLDRFNPEDDSIRDTLDSLAKLVRTKKKTYQVTPLSAYYALLLKLSTNNCKLSRQEKIQMDSLKYQFQYDYYNLAKYCQDSNWNNSEITKTGITILESLIKAL